MTELHQLFNLKEEALKEFSTLLSIAEKEYPKENEAIVRLQRLFRGSVARDRIHQKSLIAREVQRVFRGHAARQRVRQIINLKNEARLLQIYNYYALQVQKSFRGYYSRKYKQDHSSRKKYLKSVEEIGNRIRESMKLYAETQAEREENETKKAKEESFQHLTQNLHHLLSTKQIRGIYNPDPAYVETPTVDDVPIEEFLRGAVKDLLRTKGMSKTKLIRDINGTLKIPYKGLKNRLSLQASAPYDCIRNAKRSELILHKLLSMEPTSTFRVGGKTKVLEQKVVPLSVGDAYMDRWSNPLLMRGVPSSQLQLTQRATSRTTLPTFAPAPEQPFYVTGSGNKSATLPNGLFDVIADALESGGVTQRHLGRSNRFGLSTNCDNRTPSSALPLPPPKASTLKGASLGKTTRTGLKIPVKAAVPPPAIRGNMSEDSAIVDPLASSDDEDEGNFLFAS